MWGIKLFPCASNNLTATNICIHKYVILPKAKNAAAGFLLLLLLLNHHHSSVLLKTTDNIMYKVANIFSCTACALEHRQKIASCTNQPFQVEKPSKQTTKRMRKRERKKKAQAKTSDWIKWNFNLLCWLCACVSFPCCCCFDLLSHFYLFGVRVCAGAAEPLSFDCYCQRNLYAINVFYRIRAKMRMCVCKRVYVVRSLEMCRKIANFVLLYMPFSLSLSLVGKIIRNTQRRRKK